MSSLDTANLVSGPTKTESYGNVVSIDIGSKDILLTVSRQTRMPRASIIITTAASRLQTLSKAGEKVDSIVVASSEADPTSHPEFKEISENLRELRDKWFSKAKLCVICNESDLGTSTVRTALGIYDKPILNFAWGTAKTFAALTKRKSTLLTPMTESMKGLEKIVVQARFVRGKHDNSTANEVKGWIKRLEEVRPREVQIVSGKVAGDGLRACPKGRLEQIAAEVAEKTGIPTSIIEDEPVLV